MGLAAVAFLSAPPLTVMPHLNSRRWDSTPRPSKIDGLRCRGEKSPSNSPAEPDNDGDNVLLKAAWYGSELLGIAASFLRRPAADAVSPPVKNLLEDGDGYGALDRSSVVENIKEDYGRSYFVTGILTLDAYEENCEFADPAGSFRGLRRFKRNCANFGSLLEKSNMKLMKWEDFEDKGVGHWRFSCILAFPWRPILSASGYTEYFFDAHSGKICRHVEHWNVPKMVLLKQILKPSTWAWDKKRDS